MTDRQFEDFVVRTTLQRGMKMKTIKARPSELLAAIRKNYEQHKLDYAEAFEGYKVELFDAAERAVQEFKASVDRLVVRATAASLEKGDKPVPPHLAVPVLGLKVPVSHAADYEVVIRMLEFEQAELVEIDQAQFECYVMDRWDWKEEFADVAVGYSNSLKAARGR